MQPPSISQFVLAAILMALAGPQLRHGVGAAMGPRQTARPLSSDATGEALPRGAIARFGSFQLRHQAERLAGAIVTPDGKFIVAIGEFENSICVWNAASGLEARRISAEGVQSAFALTLSPDGKVLAGAFKSKEGSTVVLWDFPSGKELARLKGLTEPIREWLSLLAFGDGGKLLVAVATNGKIFRWDVQTGQAREAWDPFAAMRKNVGKAMLSGLQVDAVISPDAKTLAVGVSLTPTYEHSVVVLDLGEDKELWRTEQGYAYGLAFSADSKTLALVQDRTFGLRQARSGKLVQEIEVVADSLIGSAATFAADGKTLAIAIRSKPRVEVWDLTTFKKRISLPMLLYEWDLGSVYVNLKQIGFFPDSRRLLVAVDNELQVWDSVTGKEVLTRKGHRRPVNYLAFSEDGKKLRTGSGGNWRAPELLLTLETKTWKDVPATKQSLDALIISPDHRLGAYFPMDSGTADIWTLADNKLVRKIKVPGVSRLINADGYFLPDGKTLVVAVFADRGSAGKVIELEGGKEIGQLPRTALKGPVALAANYPALAWLEDDGRIGLFRAPEESPVFLGEGDKTRKFGPKPALALSSDGQYLAVEQPGQRKLVLWNVVQKKIDKEIEMPIAAPAATNEKALRGRDISCLAFSPDHRMLAVGLTGTNAILVVELATGQIRGTRIGHQGTVTALAFSPDSRLLASGSADTTVLVWDLLLR